MSYISKLITLYLSLFNLHSEEYKYMEASYYHDKFQGRRTASSDIFCQSGLTGATNIYEIGDTIEVCNYESSCIEVVINDRISSKYPNRVDLTKTGFKRLGNLRQGIIKVKTKKK